jgi:heme-degrading monooxygenase HmoA
MNLHHIAHVNLSYLRESIESPENEDLVQLLDKINGLADRSRGFIWRYIADARDPYARLFDDPKMLINFTVWDSFEHLKDFTYKSAHGEVFAKRKKWFESWSNRHDASDMALWWVKPGHQPDYVEALGAAKSLLKNGPTVHGFDFKNFVTPSA